MGAIQGTANLRMREATVDQDALNEAFFDGIDITEKNRGEIELLAVALGGMNEQQAAAYVLQWELAEGLDRIRKAYEDGTISGAEATDMLITLGEDGLPPVKLLLEELVAMAETLQYLKDGNWDIDVALWVKVMMEQVDTYIPEDVLSEIDRPDTGTDTGTGTSDGGGTSSAGTSGDEPGAHRGVRGFTTHPGGPTNLRVHPGEIVDVYNAGERAAMRSGGGGVVLESGAIVVYGAEGQDVEDLAEEIMRRLAEETRSASIAGYDGMGR